MRGRRMDTGRRRRIQFEEARDWTEEETATLRSLWAQAPEGERIGRRCARLGARLGRSRKSVFGRATYLALPGVGATAKSRMDMPPRPRCVPWTAAELALLPGLYAALAPEPHWARCERAGRALGRSALAVHEAHCRLEGKAP